MIRTARIVSVLGKADHGIFGAHKVLLAFRDSKYEVPAYAKSLSTLDFLVEVVSALLGRELKLSIPEPVAAISQDGSALLFASVDVKHPDLARSLSVSNNQIENTPANRAILKQLSEWKGIDKAIGFDEWIANADRNMGNVLFDGKDGYYLIDHNLAMRQPFVADLKELGYDA